MPGLVLPSLSQALQTTVYSSSNDTAAPSATMLPATATSQLSSVQTAAPLSAERSLDLSRARASAPPSISRCAAMYHWLFFQFRQAQQHTHHHLSSLAQQNAHTSSPAHTPATDASSTSGATAPTATLPPPHSRLTIKSAVVQQSSPRLRPTGPTPPSLSCFAPSAPAVTSSVLPPRSSVLAAPEVRSSPEHIVLPFADGDLAALQVALLRANPRHPLPETFSPGLLPALARRNLPANLINADADVRSEGSRIGSVAVAGCEADCFAQLLGKLSNLSHLSCCCCDDAASLVDRSVDACMEAARQADAEREQKRQSQDAAQAARNKERRCAILAAEQSRVGNGVSGHTTSAAGDGDGVGSPHIRPTSQLHPSADPEDPSASVTLARAEELPLLRGVDFADVMGDEADSTMLAITATVEDHLHAVRRCVRVRLTTEQLIGREGELLFAYYPNYSPLFRFRAGACVTSALFRASNGWREIRRLRNYTCRS